MKYLLKHRREDDGRIHNGAELPYSVSREAELPIIPQPIVKNTQSVRKIIVMWGVAKDSLLYSTVPYIFGSYHSSAISYGSLSHQVCAHLYRLGYDEIQSLAGVRLIRCHRRLTQ